jgi:hypothetical protein
MHTSVTAEVTAWARDRASEINEEPTWRSHQSSVEYTVFTDLKRRNLGGENAGFFGKAFLGGTHKELSPAYPLRITKSAFASLGGLALSVVGQGIILYSIGT